MMGPNIQIAAIFGKLDIGNNINKMMIYYFLVGESPIAALWENYN